ncbi:MAG: bifunctional glycosyltransferase/class I SAM-dependent methyltransferase [Bryobacteraceae bacterium]
MSNSISTLEFEYASGIAPGGAERRDAEALADCRGKRIGILIVTYNAVTTLAQVLRRITPEVWKNVEEVVVLDDASADATYELAVGLKTLADMDKLHVIKNKRNLGYGGNQKAGYNYFLRKGFDIVVLLHGDGQYAPEVLSHVYHLLVKGEADAVFGSRMMKKYGGPLKGGMPLYKYVGNRILTTFENRALGMNLTEFHSGYRAYSLEALRRIDFTHMTDDFHFDTEIIIKLHHQGFRIEEVPIPTYYGDEICYVNGLKYAKDVVRSVRRYWSTVRSVTRQPEYQEYFVHYPIKESKYSSHYYFQRLAGCKQDVLDIGCGEGFMAEKIAASENSMTGIDVLDRPAKAEVFEQYIQADLTYGLGDAVEQLSGKRFDKILLMDVLEHLVNSERVLQEARELLKSSGRLLVSVPNVANITVRLLLAFGAFNYTERGILDKTHLRFFTRKTARRMLEANGYEVVDEKVTVMPIELVLGLAPTNPLMRFAVGVLAFFTAIMPSLLGYQIVLVARAKLAGSERA